MSEQIFLGIIADFTVVAVEGVQAGQFLQGQFTCDIRALQSGQAVLGACCDHKGRMLFNGWIGCWQENFMLFLPKNMAAAAITHLQKFAVFSKVTLKEKSDWSALNYSGPVLPSSADSTFIHSKLSYPHHQEYCLHWLIGPAESIDLLQNRLAQNAELIDSAKQQFLQILTHLVFIQPTTQALFIPQMIGLENLGGVSFTKGCYVGQEVVARTQHLGQLKRHLQTLHLPDAQSRPQPGDFLFDENHEAIGQIAAVSQDPLLNGYRFLAVVQDRALPNTLFTAQRQPISLIL